MNAIYDEEYGDNTNYNWLSFNHEGIAELTFCIGLNAEEYVNGINATVEINLISLQDNAKDVYNCPLKLFELRHTDLRVIYTTGK